MAVIFPDLEVALVSFLQEELNALPDPVTDNVRVATIKAAPGVASPPKQVVVNANYTVTVERMIREGSAVIEVFAPTYKEASGLASFVSALLPEAVGENIKSVEVVVGPLRVPEESNEQHRNIGIDLVVRGDEL